MRIVYWFLSLKHQEIKYRNKVEYKSQVFYIQIDTDQASGCKIIYQWANYTTIHSYLLILEFVDFICLWLPAIHVADILNYTTSILIHVLLVSSIWVFNQNTRKFKKSSAHNKNRNWRKKPKN